MRFYLFTLLLFAVLACNQPQKAVAPTPPSKDTISNINQPPRLEGGSEKLYANRWLPIELEGHVLPPTAGSEAFLAFTPGQVNRVTGSTGCNTLNGSFELKGTDGIRFSPLATTRRACLPDGNNTEQRLMKVLQAANRWGFTGNRLVLLKDDEVLGRFSATAAEPAEPPSDSGVAMVNQYIKWQDKFKAGTDFLANGSQPYWTLDMDLDRQMRLRTPVGVEVAVPVPTSAKPEGNGVAYRTGPLKAFIFDKPCTDDVSGERYPATVRVETKDRQYTGCGLWLADYRLHDLWVLRSINDTAVNTGKLNKGAPTLEFNLNTAQVMGHDGCNTFSAPLHMRGKRLLVDRLISTLMACNDGGFGQRYTALLSAGEFRYRIENLTLILANGTDRLRFQKVD